MHVSSSSPNYALETRKGPKGLFLFSLRALETFKVKAPNTLEALNACQVFRELAGEGLEVCCARTGPQPQNRHLMGLSTAVWDQNGDNHTL